MGLRSYIGAVIGLVVGYFLSQWFMKGAPPSHVLLAMQTICALTGALGGLATGTASRSGNQGKAMIAAGVGLVGCLLVGLAMLIYRWLFL